MTTGTTNSGLRNGSPCRTICHKRTRCGDISSWQPSTGSRNLCPRDACKVVLHGTLLAHCLVEDVFGTER